MEALRIYTEKPYCLQGEVTISGAKNAVLPAIAACLLTEDTIELNNVPLVKDVQTMLTLINELGASWNLDQNHRRLALQAKKIKSTEAPYKLVRAMRASILVLGPLLARSGRATVALPGGCAIGTRPVDLHISGLQKLGASLKIEHGYIIAEARKLKGTEIEFEKKTVTGTENLVMAACLARGETVLKNCALEPEVVNLCELLVMMGAKIDGIGEETLKITGTKELGGAKNRIIPDRIETGTFMVASALTKGDLILKEVEPQHIEAITDKLIIAGTQVEQVGRNIIRVRGSEEIKPQDITTAPYPGFPTDMQAQFMVLMTQANGRSIITETIFDRRFAHANELLRLGASIEIEGDKAIIRGKTPLSGAEVMATDLRASACLVLAGLIATGQTTINDIEHLDRGYERIEEKLRQLGVRIERFTNNNNNHRKVEVKS
ncbi:MAG TPA: UDP-N-acetylglucosamine 1-carboxyvinyltransferase [Candidatus Saccharicenans sp.]|nr:UDP-N-acetylglucosamine 1-carboxyvinyltransferase [Candidatus Saccharicenans sp.]HQO75352.1 UDP-N-acetylglucosamine 1-carboxyvinyltransferase [Candidatus Saccharicenans sp.]HUM78631.1 UDP-N-acetylglucosamine 1-carboxyvinyltransferase [Candidatus Saccharicenans sp.]